MGILASPGWSARVVTIHVQAYFLAAIAELIIVYFLHQTTYASSKCIAITSFDGTLKDTVEAREEKEVSSQAVHTLSLRTNLRIELRDSAGLCYCRIGTLGEDEARSISVGRFLHVTNLCLAQEALGMSGTRSVSHVIPICYPVLMPMDRLNIIILFGATGFLDSCACVDTWGKRTL